MGARKPAAGDPPARRAARTKRRTTTLKPVGVSDDGTEVLLAPRTGARPAFRLRIDDSLVEQLVAAKDLVARTAGPEAAPRAAESVTSLLSIKEIQSLLRQGRSAAAIAKKAGVDPTWVERFEAPIIWERAGMAQRAQRTTLVRSRRGASELPLGEAVEVNLRARRIALNPDQIAAAWDSVKDARGGTWTVRFAFPSRGRSRIAEWSYDPEADEVHALNELASELGWVEPTRRRKTTR